MTLERELHIESYDGLLAESRVLLLDDDRVGLEEMARVLRACRARVTAVHLDGTPLRVPSADYDVAVVATPAGAASIGWLRSVFAPCTVLTVTGLRDPELTRQAFQAGADELLLRPVDVLAFVRTLEGLARTTRARRQRLAAGTRGAVRDAVLPFRQPQPVAYLAAVRASEASPSRATPDLVEQVERICEMAEISPREREVLERVLGGGSNQDVAVDLGISIRTVKFHLGNLFEKLGVNSRGGLTGLVWRGPAKREAPQPPIALAST